MNDRPRNPGGAAVASFAELPPLERRVVRCVRLWSGGAEGKAVLGAELARHGHGHEHGKGHGHGHGAEGLAAALDELLEQTVRYARRPLVGHGLDCPCAGSDECVFARFVALAAEGAREEAVLIAALIVRADVALGLAGLAESVGLSLMRGSEIRLLQ